jgi:hypothetical protein
MEYIDMQHDRRLRASWIGLVAANPVPFFNEALSSQGDLG